MNRIVISHYQIRQILNAKREGLSSALTSTDLEITQTELAFNETGIEFPDGQLLPWQETNKIIKKDNTCYVILNNQASPITLFSGTFNRSYTLRPTPKAPTLLIAGFPMHRIKGITPDVDTQYKMDALGTVTGAFLDTTTGLGYTSIAAYRIGATVTAIELDPTVIEIAKLNPWSQELVDNPRITQKIGNSFDLIKDFRNETFNVIMHDPPTLSLAGDLYSEVFYKDLYRVLKKNGRLFHYIGDFNSRTGLTALKGAIRRLQTAGFQKINKHPHSFGLVAIK